MYISTRILFAFALLAVTRAHDTAPERNCTNKVEAPAHPPIVSIPAHVEAKPVPTAVASCGPTVAHKNEMCDTPVMPVAALKPVEKPVEKVVEKPIEPEVVRKPSLQVRKAAKTPMPCMVPVVTVSLVPMGACGACGAGMCMCGEALAKLGIDRQAEAHVDIKQHAALEGGAVESAKAESGSERRLVAVRRVKKHSKGSLAAKETRGSVVSGTVTVQGERKEVRREMRNGREVETTRLYKDGKVTVIVRENGKEVSRTVEDDAGAKTVGSVATSAEKAVEKTAVTAKRVATGAAGAAKDVAEKTTEAAKDVAERTTDAAKNVAEKGVDAAGAVVGAVGSAAHTVVDGVKGAAKSVGGLFTTDASKKVRTGSGDSEADN